MENEKLAELLHIPDEEFGKYFFSQNSLAAKPLDERRTKSKQRIEGHTMLKIAYEDGKVRVQAKMPPVKVGQIIAETLGEICAQYERANPGMGELVWKIAMRELKKEPWKKEPIAQGICHELK